jgi:acyl-CoA synthetase (AMP-forming)/AMP-acid ligase II
VPALSFDAGATLAAIDAERCTSVYGVPTHYVRMLEHPEFSRFDLKSLRTGIVAGAPCPLPLMEKVVSLMGIREICIGYGQTEASPIITFTSVDDPIEVRVGTVGHPIPGLEVKVVDLSGCDLRLMSSVTEVSDIPTEGKDLIIVVALDNVLHFRLFDGDGKVVVDTDEKLLTEQVQQIEDLRKQLVSLWPPHELAGSEKRQVITAVTSIVGHIHLATRREVATGTVGELHARGHCVMAGYYNNPDATAEAIDAESWLHTGDLACRREDGNYRIVGRIRELIIRGGQNIYPAEIEAFLLRHSAVAEVAVAGLPDFEYGEVVAAWVIPESGATVTPDELKRYCQGEIARFKIPQYIWIEESFPQNVNGKTLKRVLREQKIAELGLVEVARIETT